MLHFWEKAIIFCRFRIERIVQEGVLQGIEMSLEKQLHSAGKVPGTLHHGALDQSYVLKGRPAAASVRMGVHGMSTTDGTVGLSRVQAYGLHRSGTDVGMQQVL